MNSILKGLILVCIAAPSLTGSCLPVTPGQSLKGTGSDLQIPCFLIEVTKEHPVQLTVSQPKDLAVQVSGGGREFIVDSFEFGPETVSLAQPGLYTLTVRPSDALLKDDWTFTLSLAEVSAESAAAWQSAERGATASKKSHDLGEIAGSLSEWIAIGDSLSVSRTHLKAGDAILPADPESARKKYEEALALCEPRNEFRCVAEAANNAGVAAQRTSDFAGALLLLQKAAEAWGRLHFPSKEGVTLGNIGVLYQRIGSYTEALASLEHAEALLRTLDHRAHANVVTSLGVCYLELAEIEKARSFFAAALTEAEPLGSLTNSARIAANLAETYLLTKDPDRAKGILNDAWEKAQRQPQRGVRAYVLNLLGRAALQVGNAVEAQGPLQQALAIHRDLGDRRGQASDLHYLGLARQSSGRLDLARDCLEEAIRLRRDSGVRGDLEESLYAQARLEREAGSQDRARSLAEEALKLIESLRTQVPGPALRARFYSSQRQLFDLLIEMALARGDENAAGQALLAADRGRARALMDLLTAGRLLGQIPAHLVAERTAIEHQIDYVSAQLASAKPPRGAAFRHRLDSLLTRNDAVAAQINLALKDLPFSTPLATVEILQREGLPANSALLEFHLGSTQSYLWFVDRKQIRVFLLPEGGKIEKLVRPVLDAFALVEARRQSARQRADFAAALQTISATLFGPLRGVRLPQHLILAPDGVLLRAPFAALTAPDETQPLGLGHDLVQVPAASFLLSHRRPRQVRTYRRTVLAFFDPVFSSDDGRVTTPPLSPNGNGVGEKLERLPFNDDIEAIKALTLENQRQILSDFDASRAKLEKTRLRDFAVLHFSTHAVVDDLNPEVSRLVLSLVDRNGHPVEGYLRPYQLSQLRFNNAIVVLSACDTALGKEVLGEGLAGFTSSLFEAGASELVLSLAKVDAKPTARFFAEVYAAFLGPKSPSIEHALTSSRQKMAISSQWSDPYYWASFIVMGQPSRGSFPKPKE